MSYLYVRYDIKPYNSELISESDPNWVWWFTKTREDFEQLFKDIESLSSFVTFEDTEEVVIKAEGLDELLHILKTFGCLCAHVYDKCNVTEQSRTTYFDGRVVIDYKVTRDQASHVVYNFKTGTQQKNTCTDVVDYAIVHKCDFASMYSIP